MKYKLLQISVVENLIAFLDECQEEALLDGHNTDSMQLVNFCNWAIKELLNAKEGIISEMPKGKDFDSNKIEKRWDKIDEKFFDWKLPPDMPEKDFDKMLNQFDAFLRGWEREYNKKHPDKPTPERVKNFNSPDLDDVAEYMTLKEIEEYLLDDPELSNYERFDLYYDEYRRRKKIKEEKKAAKGAVSYDQMLKNTGILPSDSKPPKEDKDKK